jgi:hypothetical protein
VESRCQVKTSELDREGLVWKSAMVLRHVNTLACNGLVNKFPRRQILGKQSVAKLRNSRGMTIIILTARI